ncbi:MAG TPA: hypothetical protein VEB63_12355 [Chitinophagaceae bacterium]|nr:hypothetical protein [Chitinophagaceae bacterium]
MRWSLLFLVVFASYSCTNNDGAPDVSAIRVQVNLSRFDRDFFSIDSNRVHSEMDRLHAKYPQFTKLFLQYVLGLDSNTASEGVRQFLRLNRPVYDSVQAVFPDADWLRRDFQKAFRYVKYYFPNYEIPDLVTVLGPIDALAQTTGGSYTPNFLGPGFLALSLQFYLGKDFSGYKSEYFIENVAPLYRSRRFSREYMLPEAMQLIADDLFPDRSSGLPLIEQMIEKGKQWWLLDKFLPEVEDTLKTGYTKVQLDWCEKNEGLIWSYLVKNEDLRSLNPVIIQTYVGEGPFTQGFPQEYSPGNIGPWIGRQIVRKFESKNASMTPEELMRTSAATILEEARYKPR